MWSGGEFRGGVGRACISEVALEAHDISLQVGCHVVICVEIRLEHWMWYLDQIWHVVEDAWKGRAGKLTRLGPG